MPALCHSWKPEGPALGAQGRRGQRAEEVRGQTRASGMVPKGQGSCGREAGVRSLSKGPAGSWAGTAGSRGPSRCQSAA